MTWLFAVLAFLVVAATAVALAGRWRPQGLPPGRPPLDRPASETRFDVVLRGYRMDQVDAELARLRAQLDEREAGLGRSAGPTDGRNPGAAEVPSETPDSRIDP